MKNMLTRCVHGTIILGVRLLLALNAGKTSRFTRFYYPNIVDGTKIYDVNMPRQVCMGAGCVVRHARLRGTIAIGDNSRVIGAEISGNVSIGRQTSLWGPGILVTCMLNPVSIGNYCSIARNVLFYEYNHRTDRLTTYLSNCNIFGGNMKDDLESRGPITVRNDVWIGANSVILSGVTIGNGAIVAAGSIVTRDVPDYAIVAGNPARILGYRLDEETRKVLLESRWWDWPEEKILASRHLFDGLPDVRHFRQDTLV